MIGYVQGEILEHADGKMLVGIGDRKLNGIIGYEVAVPQSPEYGAFQVGGSIELFIYSHVREDAFDLYGFSSRMEKTLFLTLLSVNGIGPKSALGILSAVDPSRLVEAILDEDQAFLTRIPGIGKKTADRVILELKEVVKKKVDSGILKRAVSAGDSQEPTSRKTSSLAKKTGQNRLYEDAKGALLGLGYRENDIHSLLDRVFEETREVPLTRVEDVIRTALRSLN